MKFIFLTSCKMKSVLSVLVVIFIGVCQSVPISDGKSRLVRYEDDRSLDKYRYGFETDKGISRNEVGEIKVKDNREILTVRGSYAFTGEDGKRYIVTYTSGENGYLPSIENKDEAALIPPGENVPSLGIPPAALASLAGGGLG